MFALPCFSGSAPTAEVDSGFVTAALGNTWCHSVNTRLIVQYVDAHQRQVRWVLHIGECVLKKLMLVQGSGKVKLHTRSNGPTVLVMKQYYIKHVLASDNYSYCIKATVVMLSY